MKTITPTNESPNVVEVPVEKILAEVCYGCGALSEDCRCEKNEADINNFEEQRDY